LEQRLRHIQERAYELFSLRGGEIGRDLEDWLAAERQIDGWCKADMIAKDNGCEIHLTLPGFETNEVTVTATPGTILVEAVSERVDALVAHEVFRRFELPRMADLDSVEARLDKGILSIEVPYQETPATPHQDQQEDHTALAAA
jgi:HSP20 family molecular chaperone IbpA